MVVYVAIFLLVLLVIVTLIIGILFAPFRYELQFSTREPYMLDFQFWWWLRKACYLHIRYEQNQLTMKEYIILGKVKVGDQRNYEEWLAHRVEEELQQVEDEDLASVEFDIQGNQIDSDELKDNGAMSSANTVDQRHSKEKNNQKKESKKSEINKFWFKPYVIDTHFYDVIFLFLRRVYNHSIVREFFIEGRFGLGDPVKTGMLAGLLYTLWPKHMGQIAFDFLEVSYDSSGYLKGKIIPAYLIWFGLCLVLTQPVRGFLITAIKENNKKRK